VVAAPGTFTNNLMVSGRGGEGGVVGAALDGREKLQRKSRREIPFLPRRPPTFYRALRASRNLGTEDTRAHLRL
jgi:hypothetical protein